LCGNETEVQDATEDRNLKRPAPKADDARGDDRQEIQRREVADDPAGEPDEARHQDGIRPELQVYQPGKPLDAPQRGQVRNAERIRDADQEEERIDRKRTWPVQLDERGPTEQECTDDDADRDERGETRAAIQA
jgi:hypothetical protein